MVKKNYRKRNIKKIFQLEEYFKWRDMTKSQRINFKRACLFPILVYVVYNFLSEYTYAILIILLIYLLVKFKNKNKISR